MAIKIIQRGNVPEKYRGVCNNCGCSVECAFDDLDQGHWDEDERVEPDYTVECPMEGCECHIEMSQMEKKKTRKKKGN